MSGAGSVTVEAARDEVAKLVADVVRTAVGDRLGRVAVARIANPLAEAVIAVRAELLEHASGWHQVGEALDAADPSDPASVMTALQSTAPSYLPDYRIGDLIRAHVSLDPTEYVGSVNDAARAIATEASGTSAKPETLREKALRIANGVPQSEHDAEQIIDALVGAGLLNTECDAPHEIEGV